jgi:acetyl esterase/lipase
MSEATSNKPGGVKMADSSHISRKLFDTPYAGLSPAQKLDIYWPDKGSGPFPVILSIHGGAFKAGDKRDKQVLPMLDGLSRGYVVVSINYRLSGEARFPALVHDVKAAVRWIRAHAREHSFDADRIAAWGGSAGGYLALMAGVTSGIEELDDKSLGNGDQSDRVQAVVSWFPPTDFLLMDKHLQESGLKSADIPEAEKHSHEQSPESLLLGRKVTDVPDLVRKANPATYVSAGAPPFLLQHGDADDIVPHQQSVIFAERAAEQLGAQRVALEIIPGARHGDPLFASPRVLDTVYSFLGTALGVT